MQRFAIASLLLLAVGGCASIVSDNESTTYIETDPEVAKCVLHGQDFKRVVMTPDSLHLPASAAPLTVSCSADGFITTAEELDTEIDGWIFGNILLGGGIGFLIDAARDAGEQYPPRFTVVLQPETFASAEARDAWFDARKKVVEAEWQEKMAPVISRCGEENLPMHCDVELGKLREERDSDLGKIEERRERAKVAG